MFPSLHGNWIDLIILFIILFYVWGGVGRGFILGIFDLGGFLLSFVCALKFYDIIGIFLVNNFSLPTGISNAIGFLIAGFLAQLLFSYAIIFVYRKFYPSILRLGKDEKAQKTIQFIDKILGILPGMGEAVIFTAFILTLLVTLPINGGIKKDIVSSKIGGGLVEKTQGIERKLNSIFGSAVNETLTFITVNPNSHSEDRINLHFTQEEVKVDQIAENAMFELVNSEREKEGLKKLILSNNLQALSRLYAKDMLARGYFSHYNPEGKSPFDRMDAAHISYTAAGENLAFAPNVMFAHQGLMNSPGHRANILSADYRKVGIGVIDGGIYGEMFVQEFTD